MKHHRPRSTPHWCELFFLPLLLGATLLALCNFASASDAPHRCILRDNPTVPVELPATRINDDYCDCQDGSDEPGTAACPNGTFVCTNSGHRRAKIPSSFVGDGYCDCCDGSDEPSGLCKDKCEGLRATAVADAERRAAVVRRGVVRRAEYAATAKRKIDEQVARLKELQGKVSKVNEAIKRAERKVEQLRAREKWAVTPQPDPPAESQPPEEKEAPAEEVTEEKEGGHEEEPAGEEGDGLDEDFDYAKHAVGEDSAKDEAHSEKSDEASGSEKRIELEGPSDEGETETDGAGDSESNADENVGDIAEEAPAVPADEAGIDSPTEDESHQGEHPPASSDGDSGDDDAGDKDYESNTDSDQDPDEEDDYVPPASSSSSKVDASPEDVNVDSICASLDGDANANVVVRRLRFARNMIRARMHRLSPKLFPVPPGSALADLPACVRQAEDAKWKLESQRTDLEDEISKLRKKSDVNYGSDGALRQLDGRCIKTKVLQYEFEHCPFDLVRQYEFGSPIATLGKFSRMETDEKGQHIMIYRDGDHCWNGPVRKISVHMLCGEDEVIESVDEPNRCAYKMVFRTPAVCEQKMADAIIAEVTSGEEAGKDEL